MKKALITILFLSISLFSLFAAKPTIEDGVTAYYEMESNRTFTKNSSIPGFFDYPVCKLGTLHLDFAQNAKYYYNPTIILDNPYYYYLQSYYYTSDSTLYYIVYEDGAPITGKPIMMTISNYAIGYNLSSDDTGRSFKGRSVTVDLYLKGNRRCGSTLMYDGIALTPYNNTSLYVKVSDTKWGEAWTQSYFAVLPLIGGSGPYNERFYPLGFYGDTVEYPLDDKPQLIMDFTIKGVDNFDLPSAFGSSKANVGSMVLINNSALDKGVEVTFTSKNNYKLMHNISGSIPYTLYCDNTRIDTVNDSFTWSPISNIKANTKALYVSNIDSSIIPRLFEGEYSDVVTISIRPND